MDSLKLKEIIEGLEDASGQEFFEKIVLNLSSVIQTDYVFIAQLDLDKRVSQTIAVAAKGTIVENFEYALKDTPCSDVAENSVCCYPKKIIEFFPQDELLMDMKIEGYIGTPLHDSKGSVNGLVVALSEKELIETEYVITLFKIFSGRISAEMERIVQEKTIVHMLYHDRLTNLHNNVFLEKLLKLDEIHTLLLLDINNFNHINISYGFDIGDELLKIIATILPTLVANSICCRINSDEFVLKFEGVIDVESVIYTIQHYFNLHELKIKNIGLNIS